MTMNKFMADVDDLILTVRSRATASGKTPEGPRREGVDFFMLFEGVKNFDYA